MSVTVAVCGYSRAGKDEFAYQLSQVSILGYVGSLSWIALPHVSRALNLPEQRAWETRHERREEWKAILDDYRKDDPTRLIRDSLARGPIVVGIRDRVELEAAKGLLTRTVWVHRPGGLVDPTVTYEAKDCDERIVNDEDIPYLTFKADQFARRMGVSWNI